MVILGFLEFCKLLFQIACGPIQNVVEIFEPDTADQSFDERMGYRHVRQSLIFSNSRDRQGGPAHRCNGRPPSGSFGLNPLLAGATGSGTR